MIINEKCLCGCETFKITTIIDESGKKITIICARCECIRRVTSPGVGVKVYSVSVPFSKDMKHE